MKVQENGENRQDFESAHQGPETPLVTRESTFMASFYIFNVLAGFSAGLLYGYLDI